MEEFVCGCGTRKHRVVGTSPWCGECAAIAALVETRRGEAEYVIETDGLPISPCLVTTL